ncbi:unnamed protein product [Meloidogyne enterolobii]|uniref:Uncharacterized protein n=1 Tax=Meloidogyne enterolobii TaxID=390850 RepID=A0ACB0XLS9_MELEN
MDSFIQGSNGRENLSSNGKIFVQKLYDFAFDTITKKALKILPKLMVLLFLNKCWLTRTDFCSQPKFFVYIFSKLIYNFVDIFLNL